MQKTANMFEKCEDETDFFNQAALEIKLAKKATKFIVTYTTSKRIEQKWPDLKGFEAF